MNAGDWRLRMAKMKIRVNSNRRLNLAELVSKAKKKFPGVSLKDLEIDADSYTGPYSTGEETEIVIRRQSKS